MLRAFPEQVAPVPGSPVRHRPWAVRYSPVPAPADDHVAVRGRLRRGSAAAMIAGSSGICVITSDSAGRRRVQRFAFADVMAVEELRAGRTSELQLVTSGTTVTLTGVETEQGWRFCREVRDHIRGSRAES